MQGVFKDQPVERAWLFGSYSRGEERADSDIDIMVQYEDTATISLFTISRLTTLLQNVLKKRVDLVEYDSLLPFAADTANRDKILVYERKNLKTGDGWSTS